jgi:hypothetical protein
MSACTSSRRQDGFAVARGSGMRILAGLMRGTMDGSSHTILH